MTVPLPESARVSRWLCGTHADRARFLDMQTRFRDTRPFEAAIGGTTLVAAFWYGWHLTALVVLASLTMGAAGRLARGSARPELVVAPVFALLQLNLAVSVLLSGGGLSPLLPLMAVPVFSQAVCFRPRVTIAGASLSIVLVVSAALGAEALPAVAPSPVLLHVLAYLALVMCLGIGGYHLAASDLRSRDDAVIDPLTGLFNRKALDNRFEDIRVQALVLGRPVALVMCDVDRFKSVNDTYGHDHGDRVLQELAYRMRKSVRTFDLVYRLGGEEFLVLLPGHDADDAARVAERMLLDISAEPLAGLNVTVSAGVSGARGQQIELRALVKAADVALYEAKRAGRARVHQAAPSAAPVG